MSRRSYRVSNSSYRRNEGKSSASRSVAPKHHASRSDQATEQYKRDWENAYVEMGGSAGAFTENSGSGMFALSGLESSCSVESCTISSTVPGWRSGPTDPKGLLFNASAQNIMCMSLSMNSSEAIVGSSDHSLYGFDINTGRKTRTLYDKRNGHSEWVTCVSHCTDGRVLSGGMDSKLILWQTRGSTAKVLKGHSGSISFVCCGKNGRYAISGSYDKTIRVWDLGSTTSQGRNTRRQANATEASCLRGHTGALLCCAWSGGQILSGDRTGSAVLWDLQGGSVAQKFSNHGGHVTSCTIYSDDSMSAAPLYLTGAQDGYVRVWDSRARRPSAVVDAHRTSDGGAGAVSSIMSSNSNYGEMNHIGGNVVVTAGADKKIRVLDPRAGFIPRASFGHHRSFIYSLKCIGSLCLSGGGDGLLLVHDLTNGKLLYGLGANRAAVRCICATSDKLITAGDDGTSIVFSF